jgi:V8-like Glu-specific endopeptidase
MAVSLSPADLKKLIEILQSKPFAADPPSLQMLLTLADLAKLIPELNINQPPQIVMFTIIQRLQQYGKDDYGNEALGRFLNFLIDSNFIGDTDEKKFIHSIITKYNMMRPVSIQPQIPAIKTSKEEESKIYLEAIIGENTLRPIAFLSQAIQASRSVCYVTVPGGSGSGFLVQENLLMTNNHVIPDKNILEDCEFVFNYQNDIKGKPEPQKGYKAKLNGTFHTNPLNDLDYTIVELKNSPGKEWGYVKLIQTDSRIKDRVNIIQHPGGMPKQISLQNNFVEYVDNKILQYLTSTLPGSSGAPVFNDSWRVVALHHAGGNIPEPGTGRIYFRNEGMKISRIMDDMPKDIRSQIEAVLPS